MRTFDRLVELSAPNKAFVDTAYIYAHKSGAHNEALVGRAIAKHGRDKFFLATKFGVRECFCRPRRSRHDATCGIGCG